MTVAAFVFDTRYSLFGRFRRRPPAVLSDIPPAPLPNEAIDKATDIKLASIASKSVEINRMTLEMKELAEGFLANFEGPRT